MRSRDQVNAIIAAASAAFGAISAKSIRESDACAQCQSNALSNFHGGYLSGAQQCLDYCARGHREATLEDVDRAWSPAQHVRAAS